MKNGKKLFAGLLIGGVVASAGLFAGCSGGNGDGEVLSKNSDVYGFAGATTSMLASNEAVAGALSSVEGADLENYFETLKANLQNAITSTVDDYIQMFDTVVGGSSPVETTTEDVQGEYAHKMTIKTKNSQGEERVVYFYFNETLTDGGEKVEDSDDEDRETLIDGKLVVGDLTLYVSGEKEIENNETEIEFRVSTTKGDTQNYVKFSQEHEAGEEEYNFVIVKNGQPIAGTNFSLDLEKNSDGSVTLEYENNINGSEASFEFTKTANNEITVKTHLFENDIVLKVKAIEEAGKVKYQYTVQIGNYPAFSFDGDLKTV